MKHENFSFNLYFIFHIYIYIYIFVVYLTQFHFKFSVALLLMVGCKVGQSSSIRLSYWILAKMVTLDKFCHQVVKSCLCWFLIIFNCEGQLNKKLISKEDTLTELLYLGSRLIDCVFSPKAHIHFQGFHNGPIK